MLDDLDVKRDRFTFRVDHFAKSGDGCEIILKDIELRHLPTI